MAQVVWIVDPTFHYVNCLPTTDWQAWLLSLTLESLI